MKISSKSKIMDVVKEYPKAAEVFMKHGMHCIGCAAAHFENIEEGCAAHGIDCEELISDLNKSVEEGKNKKDN